MISNLITKILGSRNQRFLKRLQKNVEAINALEPEFQQLDDAALKAKTMAFREELKAGASLDDILAPAFALVREAAVRVMKMRHFDVQLIGGMVLHLGKIAEMRTGEGKTLMSTLPIYLNALAGKGVHVVTVNDYLAKRDAAWMQPIYEFLGLTVGVILSGQSAEEKREAYNADITYGTNNEYGFDYLRDNMAFSLGEKVQRELNFAVIDEVDSILIDEARTPLIISGAAEDSSELYKALDKVVPKLTRQAKEGEEEAGDYFVDEKSKQVTLTEAGHTHIEKLLTDANLLKSQNLYDVANISLLHHLNAALRAHACFQKDVDYIVQNDEVIIVDEHTGRTMIGRRWSDGLHQAMEAKEGVKIQNENMTLASITFQNYFRLYEKLGGMTGTADTEAYEFQQIYGLEVTVIPTNKKMVRKDLADQIYLTTLEKYQAVIKDVKEKIEKKQPVLVGTASIEASEYLSNLLKKENINHQVLNAKFHEKEADIIAEAGRPAAVTIATNMAGRGTDIKLGGNLEVELAALENPTEAQIEALKADYETRHEQVMASGGLHIIGSERHESRRIDNQLRGRAGRQGDAGSSRFYLSLQDNLMRIFASDRLAPLMQKLGLTEGEAIEHAWLNKIIENAQRKVEGHNFDIRKQLLEFDDVANEQRKVFYAERNRLMHQEDLSETISEMRDTVLTNLIGRFVPPASLIEQWDIKGLEQKLTADFGLELNLQTWLDADLNRHEPELITTISNAVKAAYAAKEEKIGATMMRQLEKSIMLQSVDQHWRDHLSSMDQLRQGIHLRGYAQKNPKQEYKRESFSMFTDLLENIKHHVVSTLSRLQVAEPEDVNQVEIERRRASTFKLQYQHDTPEGNPGSAENPETKTGTFVREQAKLGRNDPCHCGSDKKYKQCHGSVV